MCAYAFNCCWLLCVLSLFSFRLTLAPPPSLCPDRPPLPCVFGKSKKKEREKHNRVRDFWSRLSRADAPPFPFFVSDHTSLSTGCVFLLASLKGLPNPDRLQLRKSWLPRQTYHTKGHPDLEREREYLLVTGIPLLFLKSVCGNLLICIPLLI